jgi:uncharacterized membrane protein
MLAAFIPYFTIAGTEQPVELPGVRQFVLFAGAVALQVIILAAGHAYLRLAWREDAGLPADERDREIERRAITWAYYVLIAGMIVVGFVTPFTSHGWGIVNAALLIVVAAEAVHYAGIGLSYRRQA